MRKLIFSLLIFLPLAAAAEDVATKKAVLMGLDKVSGRTRTFTVEVGKSERFSELEIHVEACFRAPDEEAPENKAFLKIEEKEARKNKTVFSGWMFSSSPSISAMDHNVYDIWIIRCE